MSWEKFLDIFGNAVRIDEEIVEEEEGQ